MKERVMYIGQPAGNGINNAGNITSLVPYAVPLQSGVLVAQ